MFLHIGGSRVVDAKKIVGIFDIQIKDKQCNKEFLQTVKTLDEGIDEDQKSFIVTTNAVRYSPIAPGTLKKRFQANIFDR